jgi:hypothetical protein
MAADRQRARELFLHAVGKLPPEQWDAYVAGACGADGELHGYVAHLLEVHRQAGSFLEQPAAGILGGTHWPCKTPPGSVPPVTEVAHILTAIEQGDFQAAGQLLLLVHDELRNTNETR